MVYTRMLRHVIRFSWWSSRGVKGIVRRRWRSIAYIKGIVDGRRRGGWGWGRGTGVGITKGVGGFGAWLIVAKRVGLGLGWAVAEWIREGACLHPASSTG